MHLAIDPTGRWIITANYNSGSVGVVPIQPEGTLGPLSDLVDLKREPGQDSVRQAGSHPHAVVFDPSGRFVAIPDLGLDRIFVFRLAAASRKLTANDPPVSSRANAPARATSPFIQRCPLLTRSTNSPRLSRLTASIRNAAACRQWSTPSNFTGELSSGEITVAPNGRFVYASNRCNNSIAIFAVDQRAGTLTPEGWVPTHGTRRAFLGLDPAAGVKDERARQPIAANAAR